jgi:tetratricopeptide (TPR) repeat protein
MADYFDLGDHHRTVSVASGEAQCWFDRGLVWTYGFNHEEAIRCFERVLEHDPNCAMAYWGIAYAAGPNYNRSWEQFDPISLAKIVERTHTASQRAIALCEHASPVEQALIVALGKRYQAARPVADFSVWNDAYADAMRDVYRTHPDDLDVVALFAEALLNRTPWKMWDLRAAAPAEGASTLEAMAALEAALATPAGRSHPGVLHLYIHLIEMSPFPERALRAADRLRNLVPDAGHLRHMSTHIDVLCGHYNTVVESNQAATIVDQKFLAREGAMNVYTLYRMHNYNFTMYGAMFLGQRQAALDAAQGLVNSIPAALLRMQVPPMADRLEAYASLPAHALIRFGMWPELIEWPLPEDQTLYCVTTAMLHYAKGVACSALGRIAEGEEQRALFEATVARVPPSRFLHNNRCLDLLAIGSEMLDGELEYRKGNYDRAFAHLRRAIELEDNLPYDEPWGWMQPARHAYGALLLEQGHVEEAEAVYRADLGLDDTLVRASQHPENVWALHGYHECLARLGKLELAHMIKQRLALALARADVPIAASCACRMTVAA